MIKKTALVSIILPAYNAEKTIKQAVDSVLNQTYENLELIVCVDASPDNTLDVLNSYSDPRLRVISNKENMGAGASRDKAIAVANGGWFAFIDADDFWDKTRLESMMAVCVNEPLYIGFDNLCCFSFLSDDKQESYLQRSKNIFNNNGSVKKIAVHELLLCQATLIKPLFSKELLHKSKAQHSHHTFGEDFYFLLRLLSKSNGLVYVPKALYWYRVGHVSASSNPEKYHQLEDVIKQSLSLFPKKSSERRALERKLSSVQRSIIRLDFSALLKSLNIIQTLVFLIKKPVVVYYIIEHNFRKYLKP